MPLFQRRSTKGKASRPEADQIPPPSRYRDDPSAAGRSQDLPATRPAATMNTYGLEEVQLTTSLLTIVSPTFCKLSPDDQRQVAVAIRSDWNMASIMARCFYTASHLKPDEARALEEGIYKHAARKHNERRLETIRKLIPAAERRYTTLGTRASVILWQIETAEKNVAYAPQLPDLREELAKADRMVDESIKKICSLRTGEADIQKALDKLG